MELDGFSKKDRRDKEESKLNCVETWGKDMAVKETTTTTKIESGGGKKKNSVAKHKNQIKPRASSEVYRQQTHDGGVWPGRKRSM